MLLNSSYHLTASDRGFIFSAMNLSRSVRGFPIRVRIVLTPSRPGGARGFQALEETNLRRECICQPNFRMLKLIIPTYFLLGTDPYLY